MVADADRLPTMAEAHSRDAVYFGKHGKWFIGYSQTRDADTLTESNFRTLERLLHHIDPDQEYHTVERSSHWAVGWIDYLIVRPYSLCHKVVHNAHEKLRGYPVLSDEDFSELEDEHCAQVWSQCYDSKDRLRTFREQGYTASDFGALLRAIRDGDWGEAASMLHCPSDILY